MKSDVLERLLIDHALGRLDLDVEALLTEYLSRDPAAATQARELREVVRLAAEAVRQRAPVIEIPSQVHRLVWRHRAEQMLAIAASLAIGAGITAMVYRGYFRGETVAASHLPVTASSPTVVATRLSPVESKIESLPFWSNERVYLLASVAGQSRSKARAN